MKHRTALAPVLLDAENEEAKRDRTRLASFESRLETNAIESTGVRGR